MPLEQIKTQVLLLHSEQSTLDSLSTGFDDRYTVHCATSGTEALNTLGEVPIHVIVSAQKLPGMSGLDALREAQKRSPETIGILLAGSDGGEQAIVGEKDMFQVVRDEVTPDSLRQMIDRATQQARLMALANSAANDTSANMDQPTGEHIVMETSANGSTIISDGTGRFPALNPAKISPETSVGARAVGVLVLSKDEEFLKTVRDSARGSHDIHHATTISQADDLISKNKIGVAVIDAAMVGTNVEKMTLHLRKTASRLVAIVAGRRDDGDMLMDLINRGKVYRFLLKPVSPGRTRLAIEASVKHHMEAPDSAFQTGSADSGSALAKAVPATPSAPAGPTARKPESARTDRAEARKTSVGTNKQEPRHELPEIELGSEPLKAEDRESAPAFDALGDAFEDDSSFAKTMTGMFKAPGKQQAGSGDDTSATGKPARETAGGGSGFLNSRVLGTAATLLIAVSAAGWWLVSDDAVSPDARSPIDRSQSAGDTGPAAPEATAAVAEEPPPAPEPAVNLDEVLADAREAVDQDRIYAPDGNNAIELYLAAAASLPDNAEVAAELDATLDRALGLAETALLQREIADVPAILGRVALADPDNTRLGFLEAQLVDVQLRLALADARLAVREGRFDDASTAISRARSLGGNATDEIDAVAAELEQARLDRQVSAMLEQAAARFDNGALVAPAGDSARDFYEQALQADPDNATARQGLAAIASKLVLQAMSEIDARAFPAAEGLLEQARAVDPDSDELASADRALAAEKDAVEQERLEAERIAAEKARAEREAAERAERERIAREREAAERAEQERLAREREAAERAEQERLAREREAAERAEQERLARERAAAEQAERERLAREREAAKRAAEERAAAERAAAAARLAADARPATNRQAPAPQPRQAAPQPAPTAVQTPVPRATEPVSQKPEPQPEPQAAVTAGPVEQPTDTAEPETAADTDSPDPAVTSDTATERPVVPVSSLTRTRYVAPKYPRVAERRNLTGWVDVVFTVSKDGSVSGVEVVGSEPGDTFVDAATDAVERWEFEPVIENGGAVEQRTAIRMMFAIE